MYDNCLGIMRIVLGLKGLCWSYGNCAGIVLLPRLLIIVQFGGHQTCLKFLLFTTSFFSFSSWASFFFFFLAFCCIHSLIFSHPFLFVCFLFLTFSPFLFFFSLLFSLYPISSFISFSVFFFFALGFSIFFIYFLFSGFTDWFNSLVLSFSFFISFLLLVVYYYFCFLPLPLRLSFLLDTSDCEALYMTHYSRLVVNQPG